MFWLGFFSPELWFVCVLGGDFDKWETLFCILLELWVLFRPGCIVRRNQHTLYLTPKSRLHKPTSREEQGSLAPEGHHESAEVATWKLSLPALLKPPAQFLLLHQPCQGTTLPSQTLPSHCTFSAAPFLLLGCPVSCSPLLFPLQGCVTELQGPVVQSRPCRALEQSRRQHGRLETAWSCALLSCLTLCSAFDASTTSLGRPSKPRAPWINTSWRTKGLWGIRESPKHSLGF